MSLEKDIFKRGSTTYYWSSKSFPKGVRDDVFKLYSFVRVVDDYVDQVPSDKESFNQIKKRWSTRRKELLAGQISKPLDKSVNETVLYNIAYIVYRYECDVQWVDAFLSSMEMDIKKRKYENIEQSLEYIYGSAEVIGLFMSKIMEMPVKPYRYAMYQGRAMQWVNFIRDIAEDNVLGRCYFPADKLKEFGLNSLSKVEVESKPEKFREFVRAQIDLYREWQTEAEKGYEYVPRRLRVPLKTANDMYGWTADVIYKDPMIIYKKKVKPTKAQVLKQAAKNSINV